jgi:hypothetical protein
VIVRADAEVAEVLEGGEIVMAGTGGPINLKFEKAGEDFGAVEIFNASENAGACVVEDEGSKPY